MVQPIPSAGPKPPSASDTRPRSTATPLSVGPMLNGWFRGERTIVWKAREMLAAGEIDTAGFMDLVASSAPSVGYCNTMGTALTMNSLAEALCMQLPGSATIPTAGVDFHVPSVTAKAQAMARASRANMRRSFSPW